MSTAWRFGGVTYGRRVGGDRAWYERVLDDGTRLVAYVGAVDGRPVCTQITATFSSGARDFGRELAISELERAINDSDRHRVLDQRTGELVPLLRLSEIPTGVPVVGSRGRPSAWTDGRLALVNDLALDRVEPWCLSRARLRELANLAVARGLAEPVASTGRVRRWMLTARGRSAAAAYTGGHPKSNAPGV